MIFKQRRKRKKTYMLLAVTGVVLLNLPMKVGAAEKLEQDNHSSEYDTVDYCLKANDVSIGLKEIESCADRQEWEEILWDTSDPTILVRDPDACTGLGRKLEKEEYSVDFSQVEPVAREEAYEAVVTVPPIQGDKPAEIRFHIYIYDDLPEKPEPEKPEPEKPEPEKPEPEKPEPEPAPAEPEPAPAEPEPAPAEPEPAPAEPEPAPAEPELVPAEPVPTEPAPKKPKSVEAESSTADTVHAIEDIPVDQEQEDQDSAVQPQTIVTEYKAGEVPELYSEAKTGQEGTGKQNNMIHMEIVAGSMGVMGLYASIYSDFRVVLWYQKKKKNRTK